MSPRLPVQMHLEPQILGLDDGAPIFRRAEAMLSKLSEFDDLVQPGTLGNGKPKRARVKFRLSEKGKFIHRNRWQRRNIVCCLSGVQHWLFVESFGGTADRILNARTNKNWNGYRSDAKPDSLQIPEMEAIAAGLPEGVNGFVTKIEAGDAMTFDGRWWHATCYHAPALIMFFTPGKDMEKAVSEHHRRMDMPMQRDLKIATINMAKCAKLATDWKTADTGTTMDWDKAEAETEEYERVKKQEDDAVAAEQNAQT
eukprot:CAMPEP_0175915030 /NCGR_PEP_ID=MMETSP0108-20121206/10103_1 /TAXON_ID=195067 ORGANISM="Goniomonas pacifica, Strain CCMP1869" /NCGR_SAMPLE_ID=MMETSP0108 /ASSEMBLY_ACC=CAM_ASM_000204 /LENGTH=254 /DNA_ID=CAMNT_0017237503 /DNA_START=48 /DNA_END=812 /DNA_ORIENTATION=-